jgi:type I restriction enzyme, S subunit
MSRYQAYPEYKDSGVEWFDAAPAHWEIKRISYVAQLKSGDAIVSEQIEVEGEYPVFGGNGLRGYTTNYTHEGQYILIGRQGALCGNINYGVGKFWASEHAVVVHPFLPIHTKWLGETLRAMNLNQYNVSAAQPGLAVANITCLKIPFPTYAEQTAIANFLDHETAKIDTLIEKQQQLIQLLKEKRQAVISHAVTKGLNPNALMKDSGVEWLGEVPEGWIVKRLKHISPKIGVGLVINPSTYTRDDGVYFIFGGDVKEYYFDLSNTRHISVEDSDKLPPSRLNYRDLISVRVGYPGITAVVTEDLEGANCASVIVIRRGKYNSDWLCAAMNSWVGRQQVELVSYGAAQKQFNVADAIEFVFPVPPDNEQNEIAEFVSKALNRFDLLSKHADKQIELLQERRTALISAAVTGKLDVRAWQAPTVIANEANLQEA